MAKDGGTGWQASKSLWDLHNQQAVQIPTVCIASFFSFFFQIWVARVDKRVVAEWVAWVRISAVTGGTEIAGQIADVGMACQWEAEWFKGGLSVLIPTIYLAII